MTWHNNIITITIGNSMDNTSQPPTLSHPLLKFSQHLKSIYKHPISLHAKWPPVPPMPIISLATVDKHGPMSRREVTERAMRSSQGRIDELYKEELKLEDILKTTENEYLRCILVEGAPGIGKSTFAWELCHQWDEIPNLKKYDFVLFVSLKEAAMKNP